MQERKQSPGHSTEQPQHPLLNRLLAGLAERLALLKDPPRTLLVVGPTHWAWPSPELWCDMFSKEGLPGLQPRVGAEPVDLLCLVALGGIQSHRAALRAERAGLSPRGVVAVAGLGAASLAAAQRQAGANIAAWADAHLTDMHDMGDLFLSSGLRAPVMESQPLGLSYSNAARAVRDLAWLGGLGMSSRPLRRALAPSCDARNPVGQRVGMVDPDRLLLEFELVFGHAFGPEAPGLVAAPKAAGATDGLSVVRFQPGKPKDTNPGIGF